ncbi:glycosyltransferase family 9 protein [Bdellovibrio svalbardensis]|uniref:Glycosyltransferase family 9 protein n=1 Tax=Bdellovibrio svalbardensis TaxID=2972972 RepID=A0ABT6DJ60_9BACT|nr:glycosyltransferase family 9 protein [Bdellovibrio svalbardensis]MDG0816870.1 hypothetical protein [Bdellovibrio svalbardensis]
MNTSSTALISIVKTDNQIEFNRVTEGLRKQYALKFNFDIVAAANIDFQDLFKKYERLIFVSVNCLIRPDTPNLLQVVPAGKIGLINLRPFVSTPFEYYSSDVMIFDRCHGFIFDHIDADIGTLDFDRALSALLPKFPLPVEELGISFNRQNIMDSKIQDDRLQSYIVNYKNLETIPGHPQSNGVLEFINQDLATWNSRAPSYTPHKVIKVSMNGGLGDHIDAEPVLREIRCLYPEARLVVRSTWPELFENLPYEVETLDRWNGPDVNASLEFLTYPLQHEKESRPLNPAFSHTTDYCSINALGRILPPEKKQITLGYKKDDLEAVLKLIPTTVDLSKAICIHPGLSWPNRTLNENTWFEFIAGLPQDRPVILIGQSNSNTSGVMTFKAPTHVIDLRQKLSLKQTLALLDKSFMLVTNDTGTLHLAGATDIWIAAFFSARHSAFVWPYRNQTQNYKTIELNSRPHCWPCTMNRPQTHGSESQLTQCTNWENKLCCHPNSKLMLEKIQIAVSSH